MAVKMVEISIGQLDWHCTGSHQNLYFKTIKSIHMIKGKPVINKDLTNSRLKELLKHLKIEYFYDDRWDCFYIGHPAYIEFPVNCTIKKFIELLFIVYYKNGFNDAIDAIRYVDDELFYKQRDKKIKQIKIK